MIFRKSSISTKVVIIVILALINNEKHTNCSLCSSHKLLKVIIQVNFPYLANRLLLLLPQHLMLVQQISKLQWNGNIFCLFVVFCLSVTKILKTNVQIGMTFWKTHSQWKPIKPTIFCDFTLLPPSDQILTTLVDKVTYMTKC